MKQIKELFIISNEIEKTEKKLHELKLERERKKVRYDAHNIIVAGHRANLANLEAQNDEILQEWKKADEKVTELSNDLQTLIDKEHGRIDEKNASERESV